MLLEDQNRINNQIINDYLSGIGMSKLGFKYHKDWTTIKNILIKYNIKIRPKSIKKINNTSMIRKLYLDGQSTYKIASRFKCSPFLIRNTLIKEGILIRNRSLRQRKFQIDVFRLKDLSSEIGAYWFGFLLADGHLYSNRHRIRCSLAVKDIGHLYHLSKDLNSTIPPKKSMIKCQGKWFGRGYMVINNKELSDFYRKNHWFDFKTGRIKKFKINNLNMKHFLRGLWDGDGIVTHNQKYLRMGFCDKYECVVNWVKYHLRRLVKNECGMVLSNNRTCKHGPIYAVYWTGSQANQIASILYFNSLRYLRRKFEKISPHILQI
jgi:hypothetical protein